MYSQEGIHCDTCTDAAELMEMIRQKEYSLLLTDLNMPDINGFELLELLRRPTSFGGSGKRGQFTNNPGGCGNRPGQL